MRIIEIDGEKYGLTYPHSNDLYGLMQLCPDIAGHFCVAEKGKNASYLADFASNEVIKDEIRYYTYYCKQEQGVAGITDLTRKDGQDIRIANFRPMLVPLTQGGQVDLDFKKNNPNGTIVSGGHPYQKGEAFDTLYPAKAVYQRTFQIRKGLVRSTTTIKFTSYLKKPRQWTQKAPIEIGDSFGDPEKDLQWIVWEGRMFCLHDLCNARIANLPRIADIHDPDMPEDRRLHR